MEPTTKNWNISNLIARLVMPMGISFAAFILAFTTEGKDGGTILIYAVLLGLLIGADVSMKANNDRNTVRGGFQKTLYVISAIMGGSFALAVFVGFVKSLFLS